MKFTDLHSIAYLQPLFLLSLFLGIKSDLKTARKNGPALRNKHFGALKQSAKRRYSSGQYLKNIFYSFVFFATMQINPILSRDCTLDWIQSNFTTTTCLGNLHTMDSQCIHIHFAPYLFSTTLGRDDGVLIEALNFPIGSFGRPSSLPNDYFDKEGNYLGSGGNGYSIMIVDNALDFNPNSGLLLKNSRYFNEVSLSKEAVGKIGRYYLDNHLRRKDIPIMGLIDAAFPIMALTQGDGSPEEVLNGFSLFTKPTISISMSGYGSETGHGKVLGNLTNISNFINILFHECKHFDSLVPTNKAECYTKVTPYSGDSSVFNHVSIYFTQIGHHSWENTTKVHKTNTFKLIRNEINKFQNPAVRSTLNSYLRSIKDRYFNTIKND